MLSKWYIYNNFHVTIEKEIKREQQEVSLYLFHPFTISFLFGFPPEHKEKKKVVVVPELFEINL